MTKRFKDIFIKNDACVKLINTKKEKGAVRFNILMAAIKKKIKLEEKMDELMAASTDARMLTIKMDELDPEFRCSDDRACHPCPDVKALDDGGGRDQCG